MDIAKFKKLPLKTRESSQRLKFSLIKKEMALAMLFVIDGVDYWLPKSQIQYGIDPSGHFLVVDIPMWLIREKGIRIKSPK